MSSRGSYSQKKKKEAVRRLSQQHSRQAGRGGSLTRIHERDSRRRSLEKRRRSQDELDPARGQRRRDEGKRFISPMNNPVLASMASAQDMPQGGLFGKPGNVSSESPATTMSSGGLFGRENIVSSDSSESELFNQRKIESSSVSALLQPSSSSGASLFSKDTAFGSVPSGLFGKSTASLDSSVFNPQSLKLVSFGAGLKPSTFGESAVSHSSLEDEGAKQPSFKVTFASQGVDEAGVGVAQDTLKSDRRVHSRDVSSRESEQTSRLFGLSSPPKDEGTYQQSRRTSLKRELSPSKPSSASRRSLTSHDDVFGSDISDLESFGTVPPKPKVERESMQGRAPIKRSGLFGKALEDVSGRKVIQSKKQPNDEISAKDTAKEHKQSSMFVSSSEIKHLNTIIVKDVPDELNNRIFLNKFFSKFGRVKKTTSNPRKMMGTVYFEDHESAARAKRDVKTLKQGTPHVTIFWTQKDKSKEKRKSDENIPPSAVETKKADINPPLKKEKLPASSYKGRSTKGYHSAAERYDALEERDKQIRKGLTKQSDLATAQKMIGTCPDMCPEKERYMREVQRRLSPYELQPAKEKLEKGENPPVCHPKAVKEYSRSSADQEEPLPSELRPPAVLDLTMNYLMGVIMNREPTGPGGDGRTWADWFDFLWNRTRSIRKEITQQQLCGTTAVDLMEKCARFHIYCSYRLCEEDHMTFDPKINNENLTKCLQSLKQFYADLAEEGIFCDNEAEFRAYEVLLNLTGGDILREVQQYRPAVRSSEAVLFALKVSAAFSSNNYCRFFKLIRMSSFLNACILHRYFVQLRCLALETMNKAFTTPKGVSMFPTAELVKLLAFEDDEQASLFCECHGLSTADGCIQLTRGGFFYPEESITSQRAPSVIEAKNNRSVGEVVNNGALPSAPPHTPVSSFDENGRLLDTGLSTQQVKEVKEAEQKVMDKEGFDRENQQEILIQQPHPTQVTTGQVTQRPLHPAVQATKVENNEPTISSQVIKDMTKELFLEVIDEMVGDVSMRFMETIAMMQMCPGVLADIIDEAVRVLGRHLTIETLEEERHAQAVRREKEKRVAEEAWRRQKEMNSLKDEACHQISQEIINELLATDLQAIAFKEISLYQRELRVQSMDRCSIILSEEILQDFVRSEVTDMSSEVIATATAERERILEELAEAYRLKQLSYLYQKWYRTSKKRIKIRRALETFPAGPPNQNTAEQLGVLWPRLRDQSGGTPSTVDTNPTSRSRTSLPLSLNTPYGVVTERESLAKDIMHHHYLALIRQQRALEPLDLPLIHRDSSHSSQHASWQSVSSCQYWKLIALLPQSSYDDRNHSHWLKAKLKRGKISEELRRNRLKDNRDVETLSLYTQKAGSSPLGVCTKAVIGPPIGRDVRYQLMGSSGIILLVDGETEGCYQDAMLRLNGMLSQTPSKPALPILVCVISDEDLTTVQSKLVERLQLRHLKHEGVISSWRVIGIPRNVLNPEASHELEEGVSWLAYHHPKPPSIISGTVDEYLDNGLSMFFSTNVHQLTKQRRETGQFPLSPNSIVRLYNSVMSHLASVASSPSLLDISWPPSEFKGQQHPDLPPVDWNTQATLSGLQDIIQSLLLPDIPCIKHNDWSSICDSSVTYINMLPGGQTDKAPLLSRVRGLLDKSRRVFEDICFMTFDTEGCEPSSQHAPWSDILEECVTYMMTMLKRENESCENVYFDQSELNHFDLPLEWRQEMNETLEKSVVEQESMHQSIVEAVSMRQFSLAEEDHREKDEMRKRRAKEHRPDNTSFLHPQDITMTLSDTHSGLLRRMINKEKEENLRFEAILVSFLEESDESLQVQTKNSESDIRLQLPPLPKAPTSSSIMEPHPDTDAATLTLDNKDHSLSDQIQMLKERLASEKQAGILAEMRLNALLGL